MKYLAVISFAILVGSAAAAAQAIDQYHPQKFDPQAAHARPEVVLDIQQQPISCPASMRATQNGAGTLIKVKPGQPDSGPPADSSQNIRLIAGRDRHGAVVSAAVKVHGLTNRPRMVPLAGPAGPTDISRRLNVAFDGAEAGQASADLSLHGFTAVSYIDILSVTYADGSTWSSDGYTCRVIPDPMMLIGER